MVWGDVSTFLAATGVIYRLDRGKGRYLKISDSSLLAEAEEKAGEPLCVPKEIGCNICGIVFSARTISIDGEEIIQAYGL